MRGRESEKEKAGSDGRREGSEKKKKNEKKKKKIQRNPAIAHFKGPTDFMPYCGNALLPYDYILKNKAQRPTMCPNEFWGTSSYLSTTIVTLGGRYARELFLCYS